MKSVIENKTVDESNHCISSLSWNMACMVARSAPMAGAFMQACVGTTPLSNIPKIIKVDHSQIYDASSIMNLNFSKRFDP
jgi:hypothetical protein